jgi:hypothetical protein
LDVKLLCRVRMMALIPLHRQHNRRRRPKLQNRLKILAIQKPIVQMYPLSLVSSSP